MTLWMAGALAVLASEGPSPLAEVEALGAAPVEPRQVEVGPPVLLHGGTVLTAQGERHEPGWVLLREGLIEAVGAGEPPQVEAVAIDVTGSYVTPGLIDTHSHLGVYPSPWAEAHGDGNEMTSPVTAGVWAEHSIWPQDPGLQRAVAGGVTTLHILPGSANLVGGRGVTIRPLPHRGARAMRLPGAPDSVKMACGENPKRVYGQRRTAPSTRMGNLRGQRAAFFDAREHLRQWQEYAEKLEEYERQVAAQAEAGERRRRRAPAPEPPTEPKPPSRDLEKETLAGVLTGDILAQIHCYRADEMLAMLQLADEVGFTVRSFHHALEAYKIRDILADRGVATSTWADWWGFKLEAYDAIPHNLALLADAGAMGVVHSDSAIGVQRLNQEAAKAWFAGLHAGLEIAEDEALRWITANAAWALGIEDQVGTLEPGKRADVVVWDAWPFSVYAGASLVFIDGVLRHDASRPAEPWSDFEVGQGGAP